MKLLTTEIENQTVEKIVVKLNELVDKHNLFIEAGRIVYEEINSLGKLEYGDQARIIRKVAEHPNLKYSPNQVKEAFITIRKFPKLLGGTSLRLPAYHYEVLATSRLTAGEIDHFEDMAITKKMSNRELKQAIHAHKAETAEDYPDWLQYGNCWKFTGCDPRMGLEGHPGRIPGQITLNLLHYYTEENDLFVSAFGGSGTDIDACKLMNRNCIAFDLNPVRQDIQKADLTDGLPVESESANFVFFDPPWLSAQKDKYSGESKDFANLRFEDFYNRIELLAKEANRTLKTYGYCGIIAANMPGWGEITFEDVGFRLNEIFSKFFQPTQRISIPYPTNMIGGGGAAFQISRARKEKYMLAAFADLLVYRKV